MTQIIYREMDVVPLVGMKLHLIVGGVLQKGDRRTIPGMIMRIPKIGIHIVRNVLELMVHVITIKILAEKASEKQNLSLILNYKLPMRISEVITQTWMT